MILFLKPIFQERLWGGERLKQAFNYPIPSENTGECWAISAHRNGDCEILSGDFKGKTLSTVYAQNRYLFGDCKHEVFPLLTKILDANLDLSVQVHPDDPYAKAVEGDLGKTECWYVIDCKPGSEMIYGHHAESEYAFKTWIQEGKWNQLLRRIPIKPGDFFYVPSGTIHALCQGTLILETQQSSDTTYRLYDYERRDSQGNLRELHLDKAIQVSTIPHQDPLLNTQIIKGENHQVTRFIESAFFTVEKWQVCGPTTFSNEKKRFFLVSVLNGEGSILDYSIKKGDHFIITSVNDLITYDGNLEFIVSYL